MREIRLSGSEGGETAIKAVFPTPIKRLFFCCGVHLFSHDERSGLKVDRRRLRNVSAAATLLN